MKFHGKAWFLGVLILFLVGFGVELVLCISSMTVHLSGLASIPWWVIIKPRNLSPPTPKVHILGLRRIRIFVVPRRLLPCPPHVGVCFET